MKLTMVSITYRGYLYTRFVRAQYNHDGSVKLNVFDIFSDVLGSHSSFSVG